MIDKPNTTPRGLLAVLVAISIVVSAKAGNIVGSAIDIHSGVILQGVSVRVTPGNKTAITDASGRFRVNNLAPGNYTVEASFIDYTNVTQEVTVPKSGDVSTNLQFGSEVVVLGDFVVEGYREGWSKALQQKKMSENIADIISSDSVGNLPDRNVADALSRVPGVSLLADSGEGRFVSIRGLNPNLNNTTLNGATLASPGIRNLDGRDSVSGSVVPLDVIGSAQISQIEVIKTLTPDMDANAIGGTINIRTASAFDHKSRFIFGSIAGGYANLAKDEIFEADVTYGDRFGKDRTMGLALSANYSLRPFRTEAFQTVWATTSFTSDGVVPLSLELLPEEAQRERLGLTASFDFRPNTTTSYYIRAIFNEFNETNDRQEAITRTTNGKGSYTSPDSVLFDTARFERRVYRTVTDQTQVNLTAGLSHAFGAFTIEPEVTYSRGEEDRPEMKDLQFRNNNIGADPGFAIDYSDFLLKINRGTSTWDDPTQFAFRQYDESQVGAKEEIGTAKVDFSWKPDTILEGRFKFKTGLKYYDSSRSVDVALKRYTGSFTLADTNALTTGETVIGYPTAFDIEFDKGIDFIEKNRASLVLNEAASMNNSVTDTFRVSMDIVSAYAMAVGEFGRITVLGGVRYEGTKASIRAFEYQAFGNALGTIVPNNADFDFSNIMPNLQAKFAVSDNLVLRAAITSSIRRPEYEFAAPAATLNYNNFTQITDPENFPYIATLTIGNPNLKPYESLNFDVSAEYYLKAGGIFSVAAFHKIVDNPIYQIIDVQQDTIYNGIGFQELTSQTYQNANTAKVTGVEVALQYPLTFLPAPFDGLGVDINFTSVTSEVTISSRPGVKMPFFEQPDFTANAALYYQRGRLAARLAYGYQGASLRQLNGNPILDFYRAAHNQIDAQASFNLNERFTIFANVQNLGNEPQNTYSGDPGRMRYSRYFGWNARAGLRFKF